jgi:hypothetical protein
MVKLLKFATVKATESATQATEKRDHLPYGRPDVRDLPVHCAHGQFVASLLIRRGAT